ncbi:hypothetical protein [Dethiothermospora halolimnae]|uniref:hypothetical protein n=1 Tax=Dethiothermospora halolimnae TaxID=3114390 RepID=UPI003CCB8031
MRPLKYTKEEKIKVLKEYAKKCKEDNYLHTDKELMETKKGMRILYFIDKVYESKEKFAKDYNMLDLYKQNWKKRNNRKKKTDKDKKKEFIKRYTKEIGKRRVCYYNLDNIKIPSKSLLNLFSDENLEVRKIKKEFYNILKKCEKLNSREERYEYIKIKMEKNKRFKNFLYNNYKRDVSNRVLDDYFR